MTKDNVVKIDENHYIAVLYTSKADISVINEYFQEERFKEEIAAGVDGNLQRDYLFDVRGIDGNFAIAVCGPNKHSAKLILDDVQLYMEAEALPWSYAVYEYIRDLSRFARPTEVIGDEAIGLTDEDFDYPNDDDDFESDHN